MINNNKLLKMVLLLVMDVLALEKELKVKYKYTTKDLNEVLFEKYEFSDENIWKKINLIFKSLRAGKEKCN